MSEYDPANIKIRPASSAIIFRDGADGIEVFMVVRHHQIDFASGAMVFPGGSVDTQDSLLVTEVPISSAGDAPPCPFWFAGIRETFEEAGLVLARQTGQSRLLDAQEASRLVKLHRPAVLEGSLTFADVLQHEGLEPVTDLMVHFAHWITPVGPPRRFDTHFFLIAAPVEQIGVHDGTEAVEGLWVTPARAIQDADEGRRVMLPPTRLNLIKLARAGTVQDAVARARASKVVTVLPRVVKDESGRKLLLPIEAGYGMSEYRVPVR